MTATPTTVASDLEPLELKGAAYAIERPTGLKATRALAILRGLSGKMPELGHKVATFRTTYRAENVLELDRVEARLRFPAEPLVKAGELMFDDAGHALMLPSPVDGITEAEWERTGHTFRIHRDPRTEEVALAVFEYALDAAERDVYRLLALFTIPNADLARAYRDEAETGGVSALIERRVDELLEEAFADEWVNLAGHVAHELNDRLASKVRSIGGAVGKALGWTPTSPPASTPTPTPTPSAPPTDTTAAPRVTTVIPATPNASTSSTPSTRTDEPSSSPPSSSTGSPATTPDGPPTSSSPSRTTSSSSSPASPTTTVETATPPSSSDPEPPA